MEDQSRPAQAQAQAQPQPPPPPVTGYPAPGYHSAQSNTAYPYYNPNPNPYNNPTPYPSPPRISFLRRLIFFLIGVFIVFATVSFIIWLVLRPRLPEFRVDSVTVSNFTVSSSSSSLVTGNWDVKFSVRNPNKKMSIYYDRIDSYLYYKSSFLSEASLAPFYQATKDQTMVSASFASRGNYVEGWVVNDINEDKKVGIVGFDVRVLARVRFKNGVWRMRRRLLRVLCPKVKVKLTSPANGGSSSGTLLTGNWECRVGM